jgi:predicted nuclease of restriction endonuclease-like RecB superfamily
MLTKELAIFNLEGSQVKPDCLTQKQHGRYVAYAQEMLRLYREGIGKTRHELHSAVRRLFSNEPDCPPQRIAAFCKLLDEERIARFDTDRFRHAAALRRQVFDLGGQLHPLVQFKDRLFEHSEMEAKQAIARKLGRSSWFEIEVELFADVFEFNRLQSFAGYDTAAALLSRYNVAQVQASLFNAKRLFLWARADFQRIITHAKLAHLLHDITPPAGNQTTGQYKIVLDGPASVLRETRRYGVNLARFLPALLSCRDWRMAAEIIIPGIPRPFWLKLSSDSGLKSPMPPPAQFDSSVEARFAKKWGPGQREGWSLRRAGAILQRKQTASVPDFVFHHDGGRKVYLEIVGFWTPEYLRAKVEKLKLFEDEHIILAVAQSVRQNLPPMSQEVIPYKTVLKLNDVLAALAREAAVSPSAPHPVPLPIGWGEGGRQAG